MFNIFTVKKRNKKHEMECQVLNDKITELEYKLRDAKEIDKFHAESERSAWQSRYSSRMKKESRELKDRLEAENNQLKSQLREQNDADLILLALQDAGMVLSKGAVDKFVADEVTAKKESVRKRMTEKSVESLFNEQRAASIIRHGYYYECQRDYNR